MKQQEQGLRSEVSPLKTCVVPHALQESCPLPALTGTAEEGRSRRLSSIRRLSAIRYPLSASRSSGMSLVAALFLIVVIAALGAFAVRIGMGQQQTVNLSLLGNRAMAAANAGIEWSAYRALEDGNCSNGSLNLTQGAFAGFTVDISCESTSFGSEGTLYVIEAASRYGTYGRADYVSRRIRARFFE